MFKLHKGFASRIYDYQKVQVIKRFRTQNEVQKVCLFARQPEKLQFILMYDNFALAIDALSILHIEQGNSIAITPDYLIYHKIMLY